MLISFGQASWHSPYSVHGPKPSRSICSTIASARLLRSAWPCGRLPRWEIFAAVNSDADPFGHALPLLLRQHGLDQLQCVCDVGADGFDVRLQFREHPALLRACRHGFDLLAQLFAFRGERFAE